ncbi:flagellar brake protein [Abyssisolibacter fermentans]|uniref:flagellar brake protein n=1 Tax=Abyssisolibacter fermentans TaxID=1766203 RepID=UPI00082AAC72|nr:flagellar brake domain-containing protein [Abyssisolibacter fermentans]
MPRDEFKIGQKITIQKDYRNDEEFKSQIVDIFDDDFYKILRPISKSKLVPLYDGSYLTIKYYVPNKGRYSFKAKIVKQLDNKYEIIVKNIGEFQKIQERNHFRLPIELEIIKKFEKQTEDIDIKENCITKDISGTGARILCNYKHKINDIIKCNFSLDDSIELDAKIVRINRIDSRTYKYSLGIEFIKLDKRVKEILVKYIFKQQREMRKKGMI